MPGSSASAAPTRPAILSVSHLAVYAADMAKSEAFYTHQLGALKGPDPEDAVVSPPPDFAGDDLESAAPPAAPTSVTSD